MRTREAGDAQDPEGAPRPAQRRYSIARRCARVSATSSAIACIDRIPATTAAFAILLAAAMEKADDWTAPCPS
ncbi:hypothetical protein ABIA35_009723 [Catenulispora sp. MAP12-49]